MPTDPGDDALEPLPHPAPRVVRLHRQPDGTYIDWGRHARTGGVRGDGPAVWYRGEAAEVMRLVLRHTRDAGPSA